MTINAYLCVQTYAHVSVCLLIRYHSSLLPYVLNYYTHCNDTSNGILAKCAASECR